VEYSIFIDDWEHGKGRESPSYRQSDAHGFLAALIPGAGIAPVNAAVAEIQQGFRTGEKNRPVELHGYEIAAGEGHFKGIAVPDRAALFGRALAAAETQGAEFLYEVLEPDDPVFRDTRAKLREHLAASGYSGDLGRWGEKKGPRLAIATFLRHFALRYAIAERNAHVIVLVEDSNVPRDDIKCREMEKACREKGISLVEHYGQDSANWPGLQIADLAATVARLQLKVRDHVDVDREAGVPVDPSKWDAFTYELIQQDILFRITLRRALDDLK